MSSLYRGAKNAFRSVVRTFAVVLILALCVGLALAMALGPEAVAARSEKAVVVAATHDEKIMNVADRSFPISDGRFVKSFTVRDGKLVEEKDMRPPPMEDPKPRRVAS